MELSVVRYKPDGINALARTTKFTKKELQLMYRGFKAVSTHKIMSSAYSILLEIIRKLIKNFSVKLQLNSPLEYIFSCILTVIITVI